MAVHTDPDFLANLQYGDAGGLSTRIEMQERYSSNPEGWFQWLFDRFHIQRQSRILELGCGPDGLEVVIPVSIIMV